MDRATLLPVIQSASDVGSAVAHRLKRAGFHPVLLESPAPTATRRRMAFAGAMFTGEAVLEGVRAVRCTDPRQALTLRTGADTVPVLAAPSFELPPGWQPDALVDARMRKKLRPPQQLHLATFTVGIGPGFTAGEHTHVVIESNHGERMGALIHSGSTEPYTGKHREIEGFGKQRYLYAPLGGIFRTTLDVGAPVRAGSPLGDIGGTPLLAEIDGAVRGLAYDGVTVTEGAKVAEIDPTSDPRNWSGIASRPRAIAEGVLLAIWERWPELA